MDKLPKSSLGKAFYIVKHMKKLWPVYVIGLIMGATVNSLFSWSMSRIMKALVISAENPSIETFMRQIGISALFCIGVMLIIIISDVMKVATSAIGRRNFRHRIANSLLNATSQGLLSRHSGEWLAMATSHTNKTLAIIDSALGWVASTVITPITASLIVFPICWPMAVAAIIVGIVMLLTQLWFSPKVRNIVSEENKAAERMTARLSDIMMGYPIIRGFRMYKQAKARFDKEKTECFNWMMKWAKLASINSAIQWFMWNSVNGVTLLVGMICVNKGFVTLPNMLGVWLVCNAFSSSIGNLGSAWLSFQEQLASYDRVVNILTLPQESSGEHTEGINNKLAIEFENASFKYPDSEIIVIDDINLSIYYSDTLAFVGGSGGGKSTLIKLMLRLYDTDSGNVKIFGRPIKDWNLHSLRSKIAVVPQSPHMFDGTVAENIEMGRPGSTQEEIETAAKRANAHDFVSAFPKGYNTVVGERGTQLSGGQKQRIAIARAFLKNAPILALDEATASLDGESEHAVQIALRELMIGRTVLWIAHRLSTAREAKQIAVVEGGKIVECGTHDELIVINNRYAELWRLQTTQID